LTAWTKSIHQIIDPRSEDTADNQRFNVAKQNAVIPSIEPIKMHDDFAGLFVLDIILGIKEKELAKDPIAIAVSCQIMLNLRK
jgi:hypothetical protein